MKMKSFASVNELINHLRAESAKGERFATRFILIQGRQGWVELIPKLAFEVDRVVRLSEFCSGPDVFPDMTRLESYLKYEIKSCRNILIIPLAECIRLDSECAEVLRLLAEWPTDKVRRIYVPLLAAEEFFFDTMNTILRYRAGELPDFWSLKGEGNSDIIVAPFSSGITERQITKGIKEYLSLWEQCSVSKVWLVTDMARWLPVRRDRSDCRVRLYPSSFDYICRNIGWDNLREEWGSPRQWEWLAAQIHENDDLDRVAGRVLNVAGFNADQLFTLWSGLDDLRRWFVWLWSKGRSKSGTYLHHVLNYSSSVDDFIHNAVMVIFNLQPSVSLSRERKKLLQRLGVNLMPAEFWERYRELTDPLDRVAVLTGLSVSEREQLVLCAGELLAKYPRDLWWEYLEISFPELTWYLQPAFTGDEFADLYFSVYNCCRLKDQMDEELSSLIDKWAGQQLLWSYPGRSDLVAEKRANGAKVLWVDAMGVEWTGLLTQLLTTNSQVECEVRVTRAHLPTITDANKEWEADEEIIRGLDDIAHHYAYQFPQSLLKSIEVIEKVAHKALALLSQYPTVVITSDHGLSRFAAISDLKVNAPEGAKVEAQGRYALLEENSHGDNNSNLWVMEEGVAYLLTHNRFKGGSTCRGEVHSGATPEECLTPVIVVRKASTDTLPRFDFDIVTVPVKVNAKGEGVLIIRCNRKVASVELRMAGHVLPGQVDNDFTWSFNLKGLKAGNYTGKLYCNNRLAGEISFVVMKGIIQDDLGL
jgi:hypothetical protein